MRILVAAGAVLLSTSVATAVAAPGDPVPVKNQPGVEETTPTTYGDWLGWVQSTKGDPDRRAMFVQQGDKPRVKVNARLTHALGGGITGHSAFYAQQRVIQRPGKRDVLSDRRQIVRLDLETGKRTVLPASVNRYRITYGGDPQQGAVRGDVSVSGPWLMFTGRMASRTSDDELSYDTAMLYNRVTHKLRVAGSVWNDISEMWAGQVNGGYAVMRYYSYASEPEAEIQLYDIATRQRIQIGPDDQSPWGPGVGSDGTAYYFQNGTTCPDGYCEDQLMREPLDGPPEVVVSLPDEEGMTTPSETFVEDRPDGSRVISFSWNGDIYQVTDDR